MHKPRAQKFLVSHLREGTLVLFLGAGASVGLGLPSWDKFINGLRSAVGLPTLTSTMNADELQLAADEVKSKFSTDIEYKNLLKKCLYEGMDRLSSDILRSELLTALGGLLMGSRRGKIRRVVTLNFDSMLEWFLSLYGFDVRVIYRLPELEGSEDVRIYHPNGFLPHTSLNSVDSDFVILGLNSVNERLGTLGDPWYEMTRHLLRSGVCLFVGMSARTFMDRSLGPLLRIVANETQGRRVTGVWLLREEIPQPIQRQFLDNNVAPIMFSSEKDIADFLLGICQKAAIRVHV
jgi:hypothetical protein